MSYLDTWGVERKLEEIMELTKGLPRDGETAEMLITFISHLHRTLSEQHNREGEDVVADLNRAMAETNRILQTETKKEETPGHFDYDLVAGTKRPIS